MSKSTGSRRHLRHIIGAATILIALTAFAVWYVLGGRSAVASSARYLRARPLSALAVEANGTSVEILAVVPHPPTDPYDIRFLKTALVGGDRFWVPVEIENRSSELMYLRMRAAAKGPQLLLPEVEYRLRGGCKETVLLPLSREGAGNDKRVIINATLDIGEERYRTQLILFDITPVLDVFAGRDPGRLTLME